MQEIRTMAIDLPVFGKFRTEGEIIGRLLVVYGELEIALCRCVAEAVNDLDLVVKKMFLNRGGTSRIDTAVRIGRGRYESLGLIDLFEETICGMRCCLKIRNQFAHCNFYEDPDDSENLLFANLEHLAKQQTSIDELICVPSKRITQALLEQQATYFVYIWECFSFLRCEARVQAGKLPKNPYSVEKVDKPQPHIPS
jgi:hypothetical protein